MFRPALLLIAIILEAQQFEVASIRPTPGQINSVNIHISQGGFKTSNTSLVALVQHAYDARPFQVLEAAAWMRDLRYDINAKNEDADDADVSQKNRNEWHRARLRKLLADRFQLKIREEIRELPVYALVVDKQRHKMKIASAGNGSTNTNQSNASGRLRGDGISMRALAVALSAIAGRTVLDETGLAEPDFEVELNWSEGAAGEGPSLFTAVREQLGLRLESKKGPVPVYVIESAARPTEN